MPPKKVSAGEHPVPVRSARRRVTAEEVARRAGVSTATVSYVFTGKRPKHVSDKTRARVRRVAAEMGFVPSRLGSGFLRGRSHIIGVVMHYGPVTPWIDIVVAINRELAQAGYVPVVLSPSSLPNAEGTGKTEPPAPLSDLGHIRRLLEYQVDGLIYLAAHPEQAAAIMPEVKRHRIPLVLLGNSTEPLEADLVTADNDKCGRMVARHLLSLGARSFLLIENESRFLGTINRRNAFVDELAQAGKTCRHIILHGNHRKCLDQQWPRKIRLPIGIFTTNDLDAGTAVITALERGWRVPEDVAVVGHGDSEMARQNWLPLASVRKNTDEAGRKAVALLLERLDGFDGPPRRILIDPHLELRESAMPAPESPKGTKGNRQPPSGKKLRRPRA